MDILLFPSMSIIPYGRNKEDTEMVDITEIRANDFEDCLIALRQSFSNSEIYPEQAVMEKYKPEKHFAVAKTRPTPIF